MKAFNKIGFHTSVGGNPTGIREWMEALDAAGIPFFIKAADAMTGLFDAQQIIRGRGSTVPHTLVFRRSGHAGEDYDVPDYTKEPEEAAVEHWQRHKATFPPEMDKELVWVETINELRKEVQWADWIGNFAYHTGQIALAEGYKFSAFGYSTGTPEEGAWETDGMLRYLELCQEHPEQLSVALHEYSLKVEDIWFLKGDHIGRFRKLFQACDKHHVKRPYVLITEWGWTHNRVPKPEKALRDIEEVGELYARYPQVLGAALWYLGPGWEGIANQAQLLIKPVTDFTLNHRYDAPDPEEESDETPPMSPAVAITTGGTPNARFITDVTIPDDSAITAGSSFVKTWRVENTGDVAWGDGYTLVHTAGTPMTNQTTQDLPRANPGQQIEISVTFTAPQTPGSHFSDWRFRDPQGNFFGDIIYTRILSRKAPEPTTPLSNSKFVADVTIPDDKQVAAETVFTKTWRVRNTGNRAWGAGFTLEFIGGTAMTNDLSHSLPNVQPGQEAEMSVVMRAPSAPGVHFGDWRMKDDQGRPFGEVLFVRIVVPSRGAVRTPPLSQRDSLWANQRLGHAGSPHTIGAWGCLLTCFAMTANAFGKDITPAQLNTSMMRKNGYLNLFLTKWNALSDVYQDVVYEGKVAGSAPGLLERIDASLAQGRPVSVQVDFTRDTPYTDNDQHWVLVVGRDGDDYRINDPWLLPPHEASLRDRYGRSGRPLQDAILSAIFYRSTKAVRREPPAEEPTPGPTQLQTGMNINPDAPHSNPMDSDVLKGLDWVRFVFKLDARVNESERGNIRKAFDQYDVVIREYDKIGVNSLVILNQETLWGNAPWNNNGDWNAYANNLAALAREIATRYRRYGERVAYQIWNEGDKKNNPASVYLEPERFALVLKKVASAIRDVSPNSPIISMGMATGPSESIAYLKRVQASLAGPWPVDAIGIHPYTRWATKAPFDWGQQYGTLAEAFAEYRAGIPDMPLWITEIGVAADNEIGPQFYREIGMYLEDVYRHIAQRHTDLVPVVIWFAWSDWMRNAGVVTKDGTRKDHVYPAFRTVRNQELFA